MKTVSFQLQLMFARGKVSTSDSDCTVEENVLPWEDGRRNSASFQQIFCNRKSKACRRRRQLGSDLSVCAVRALPYTFAAAASFPHSAAPAHTRGSEAGGRQRERAVLSKRQTFLSTPQRHILMHSEPLAVGRRRTALRSLKSILQAGREGGVAIATFGRFRGARS